VFAALASASGCTIPGPTKSSDLVRLSETSAADRAVRTREFETRDAFELLSASAAVLQDLGFQVTESERELGFLKASKERSAREYGQEWLRGFVAMATFTLSVFGGSNATIVLPVDLHQQVNASLVAQPLDAEGRRHEVHIVFYRVVWKSAGMQGDNEIPPGIQRMEMIRDGEIYQQFFARLSKSVFLEAHKI
jgi:hypothetical protein